MVVVHLQPNTATSWPGFLPIAAAPEWLVSHARLGFESFFVLTAYFLAHTFRPGTGRPFSVFDFFRRRAIRLLPPYWLILIISWLGMFFYAFRHHIPPTWSPPGFWRQMLLLHNPDIYELVAPQLWFMVPLIQFYLVWGIVFWLLRKTFTAAGSADPHRAAIRVMTVMMAVVFVVSIFVNAYRGELGYTLLINAHYLALGCLIYWHANARVGAAWLLCALGMEVALGCAINESRPVATLATSLLLVHIAGRAFSASPKLAWIMVIGRCSYSIYLTHILLGWRTMGLFVTLLGGHTHFWGATAVTSLVGVFGCVLGGYAYNRMVEQPFARWARKSEFRRVEGPAFDPGNFARSTSAGSATDEGVAAPQAAS